MDNPNDPNTSNNPNPTPQVPPIPPPVFPPAPEPPASLPSLPQGESLGGLPSWPPPPPPSFTPFPPLPSTPPVTELPDPMSTWTPPVEAPPTLPTQPVEPVTPVSESSFSALDNPWGSPPQAPAIDGLTENPQTSTPPWMATSSPPSPQDAAPTDLSHLITNNNSLPETLVVPPAPSASETETSPIESHKGIPRWIIGVGIGLLLAVVATSLYFILGIGQAPKTTSQPATVSKTEIKPPVPITTPVAESPEQSATGSASFGDLQGGGQQATSAADLLRQRQQQGR